jgi:hypothetical protein
MFLAAAAILLLLVILTQNILYKPLRQETISDGLYGPYHWWLDGAYVVLATALVSTFWDQGTAGILAWVAAGSLMITAVSNTFSGFVDSITDGKHADIHTWFSILMFLSLLGLQVSVDHGVFWELTAQVVVIPVIVASILTLWKSSGIVAGPAAEKTAVFFICVWLIAWSVTQ